MRESIFERLFEVAEIARFTREEASDYEDSLKVYRDLKNSLDTAREEARKEAWDEAWGEAQNEERLATARSGFDMGLSDEAIAQLSRLDLEKVQRLREELEGQREWPKY